MSLEAFKTFRFNFEHTSHILETMESTGYILETVMQ